VQLCLIGRGVGVQLCLIGALRPELFIWSTWSADCNLFPGILNKIELQAFRQLLPHGFHVQLYELLDPELGAAPRGIGETIEQICLVEQGGQPGNRREVA
jgi:hypothetical protein